MSAFSELSVRTANALFNLGYRRREDVLRAVKDRTLHPTNSRARGVGKKAIAELRAWLGLEPELNDRDICRIRARIAAGLHRDGLKLAEIGRVLRISKEKARSLVHKGERLKREGKA